MSFENYLIEQINRHPSFGPQDVVKMCYQAAFGAEHLLSDIEAAKKYFDEEYAATKPMEMPIYEPISENVCRVNMAAWKYKGLPKAWLFKIFTGSMKLYDGNKALFLQYLEETETALQKAGVSFETEAWHTYLNEYKNAGMTAVHHSYRYRENENPAYRIAHRCYMRLLPLLETLVAWIEKNAGLPYEDRICVIAIDGRAASGKSTMAQHLADILSADIVHMDDFFLPLDLRTKERFEMPGGNIHYERFIEEVLPFVAQPKAFSYRRFDCGRLHYHGEKVIQSNPVRIVEGSYSLHPLFGDYADITVFSTAAPELQLQRICKRNGSEMAKIFETKWIPLEECYFETYNIAKKADLCL